MPEYRRKTVGVGALMAGALLFGALPAGATVISGEVGTDKGAFEELFPNDGTFNVGNDSHDNFNLYAFNEVQNYELSGDLAMDGGLTLKEGTIVASHFVFFDPESTYQQTGTVEFDAKILGIISSTDGLKLSDFLGSPNVNYLMYGNAGLENTQDVLTIDNSDSGFRLNIELLANSPGDYVRVLTERSPTAAVPLPAAGWMLLAALGGLLGLRWRRAA